MIANQHFINLLQGRIPVAGYLAARKWDRIKHLKAIGTHVFSCDFLRVWFDYHYQAAINKINSTK